MKYTWSTPEDPTPPIFHWLASGVGVGANANISNFRYQHVVIPNAEFWRRGVLPNASPRRQNFASQWNIGFNVSMYQGHNLHCQKAL